MITPEPSGVPYSTPKLHQSGVRGGGSIRRWPILIGALALAAVLRAAPVSPGLTQKIDRLFAAWDRPDVPGVIVAVARDGETIHARGYGMANLEHGIALTPETVSESGSVAKQFTAAAVVLLAQRGRLSLDDSIRRHLPELPAALADAITVRMLLNHTSGLRDIHGLFDLMGRPSYTSAHDNDAVLRVMSRQRRLNFAPGTEYLYCNAGYILAALIVQRASGRAFGAFCTAELFQPRGMTHTRWRDDFTAPVPGRATGYARRSGGGYRIDTPYSNLVGNGGLLTTVGDLLRWTASFDGATGEWGEVVRVLQTPSRLKDGRVLDYGLGLGITDYAGLREISHGGATSGYKTFLARFPEQRLALALLGNAGEFNPAAVSRALIRTVLELPPAVAPPRIAVAGQTLESLAGLYHSARTDERLKLTVRNGKLLGGGTELIPTGPGRFTAAGGRTKFAFSATPARRLTITTHNGAVDFVPVAAAKPSAAQLAAYAGEYYSEELEVTHTVTVSDGRLAVAHWPGRALRAEPTFADGFQLGRGWHATFTRDAAGGIDGCELSNGRCRRVKFGRR
jgi:CubicO group peptidase (beta-lactamase class C family)